MTTTVVELFVSGRSASGEGSMTTTVVELLVSGKSGSMSIPSTGVTVQVVGVAAAILLVVVVVELHTGKEEASEDKSEVSEGTATMAGLEVPEGAETVVVLIMDEEALDDGEVFTGGDVIIVSAVGVHDEAVATIEGGATVGVVDADATGCTLSDDMIDAVGVVIDDATVILPDDGNTMGVESSGDTFTAITGRENMGALLTEGGDVTEGVANLETRPTGAGKLFKVDDLMSGAGAFVKLCVLPCLAEFCRAGMADAVTTDGGTEMGKRFHGPGGKLSSDDAAITAGGRVELERLRVGELTVFDPLKLAEVLDEGGALGKTVTRT